MLQSSTCGPLRLVSFDGRRYTIRSLRPQTTSVALRQLRSVTGSSLGGEDARGFIGRVNRHNIEASFRTASSPGTVAVFQRESASCTSGDSTVDRHLRCARDL